MKALFVVLASFVLGSAAMAQSPPTADTRDGSLLLLDALDGVRGPQSGLPKVVGGIKVQAGDDPWQVALLASNGTQFCSGSLIAPRWVVTAAHCVDRKTRANQLSILTGTVNLTSGGKQVRVLDIAVHELWDPATHDFDVAVLRIESGHAGTPIHVMTGTEDISLLRDGVDLRATGWGSTAEGAAEQTYLRAVEVPFQPANICNKKQSYNGAVTSNMLCAGFEVGGIDTCQGDSGGPLTVRTAQGRILAGAVSWGDGCGRAYKFGVYARLSRFTGWLRLKMDRFPQ